MNTDQSIDRTIVLFIALAVAGLSVAVSSLFVSVAWAQTIMIAIGSAILGAGLAFFLVRVSMLTGN